MVKIEYLGQNEQIKMEYSVFQRLIRLITVLFCMKARSSVILVSNKKDDNKNILKLIIF